MNNYSQAINEVGFLQEWNGKKGFRYNGIRVQTSNGAIAKGDFTKAINTPLVKQLYQYANEDFERLVKKGFIIKHKLTTILFYKENENYILASENVKTKEITAYVVSDKTVIKETDKALAIPLQELNAILKLQVFHN